MRFPWSKSKATPPPPASPADSRRALDDSITLFFNSTTPQKSPLAGMAPQKDEQPYLRQPFNLPADSTQRLAECRIRQWMREQEAQERLRYTKIRKP